MQATRMNLHPICVASRTTHPDCHKQCPHTATPSTFETHDDHMPHCTEALQNKQTELQLINYDKTDTTKNQYL
jgi:hypothetical protein